MRVYVLGILFICCFSQCRVLQPIQDGQTAFELKQYALAAQLLTKDFKKVNNKVIYAYKAGLAYERMGDFNAAVIWFEKAAEIEPSIRILEKLAEAYKRVEAYPKALEVYKRLEQVGQGNVRRYSSNIASCFEASKWKQQAESAPFKVTPLAINSTFSDFGPSIMYPYLFFTSNRPTSNSKNNMDPWTGLHYYHLFQYNIVLDQLDLMPKPINSALHNATSTLYADGKAMFYTRCESPTLENDYCSLYTTFYEDNVWSEPMKLPFCEAGVNFTSPFWSETDSILFFSKEAPGGYGGFDLYYTRLNASNEWGTPKNMGPIINTEFDEKFPFFKNDTLFFASSGHFGMGGLDIFYSVLKHDTWTSVVNMEAPINSGGDDFGIAWSSFDVRNTSYLGVLSSNRTGNDALYFIEKNKLPLTEDIEKEVTKNDPSKKLYVAIQVLDNQTNEKIVDQVTIDLNGIQLPGNGNISDYWVSQIHPNTYRVFVQASGYYSEMVELTARYDDVITDETSHTYNLTIALRPIQRDKEIVLSNILYDFNESFICEDAVPALDSLYQLLVLNPSLRIELASHTDCIGNDRYNLELSQKRAQAVVDYLVQKGIAKNRLIPKGYGESQPRIDCVCDDCSEQERQQNRRTSFKVQ